MINTLMKNMWKNLMIINETNVIITLSDKKFNIRQMYNLSKITNIFYNYNNVID